MKTYLDPVPVLGGVLMITSCGDGEVPPSRGFTWIVPGRLAATPLPGRDRPLAQDAAFVARKMPWVDSKDVSEEPPPGRTSSRHRIGHLASA